MDVPNSTLHDHFCKSNHSNLPIRALTCKKQMLQWYNNPEMQRQQSIKNCARPRHVRTATLYTTTLGTFLWLSITTISKRKRPQYENGLFFLLTLILNTVNDSLLVYLCDIKSARTNYSYLLYTLYMCHQVTVIHHAAPGMVTYSMLGWNISAECKLSCLESKACLHSIKVTAVVFCSFTCQLRHCINSSNSKVVLYTYKL